jgi:hypothetical protein
MDLSPLDFLWIIEKDRGKRRRDGRGRGRRGCGRRGREGGEREERGVEGVVGQGMFAVIQDKESLSPRIHQEAMSELPEESIMLRLPVRATRGSLLRKSQRPRGRGIVGDRKAEEGRKVCSLRIQRGGGSERKPVVRSPDFLCSWKEVFCDEWESFSSQSSFESVFLSDHLTEAQKKREKIAMEG